MSTRLVLAVCAALLVGCLSTRTGASAAMSGEQKAPAKGEAAAGKFSRNWTLQELLPSVTDLGTGRDFEQGREMFRKTSCGVCHAFGSESQGTELAPDLSAVASTNGRDFILQSILEPSATVNGRYLHTTFTLKNGKTVTGSVIDVAGGKIRVAPAMMAPQMTVEIAEADVKSEAPSPVSAMPAGLVNGLTREQIVELMAFLDSGGDRNAPVYRKK